MSSPAVEVLDGGQGFENLSYLNVGAHINKALGITGAENVDPLRFAFIQSLLKRSDQPHHVGNSALKEKAINSVRRYTADLLEQRADASILVADILNNFPEHLEAAESLFGRCKFKQLSKLSKRLTRDSMRSQGLTTLRELNRQLSQLDSDRDNKEQLHTLDDMLSQQQQNARSLVGKIVASEVVAEDVLPLALRAVKLHRESTKRFNIDQIVARAINDGPENPGPHNPQMLAIEALTQMRDLSPKYSRRFARYIETLIWLDNPGGKLCDKRKSS